MDFSSFTIKPRQTFYDALVKIENNKKGFLIVVDEEEKVIGTLTDGDIRRALIKQKNLADYILTACNKEFEKVFIDDGFSKIIELFKTERIRFLPILEENGKLKNIISKNNMHILLLEDMEFDVGKDFLALDDSRLEHEIYDRPWGIYKTTFLNERAQSKIIKVSPRGCLSLQEHKQREEYWVVISGIGEVTLGESKRKVESGSYVYIPKGCKHRLVNSSESEVLMISEVQLGDYFGEDDIIRYEDIYGRG